MDGSEDLWGTLVSEIQSDIAVSDAGKITGTLEITKLDVSTSEPLPNTLFEIL